MTLVHICRVRGVLNVCGGRGGHAEWAVLLNFGKCCTCSNVDFDGEITWVGHPMTVFINF